MGTGPADVGGDLATDAHDVRTATDLARVLRDLRRREARQRRGKALTYREIADRAGWSVTVTGEYLTGAKLPSVERFDDLVRMLGASAYEQGVLATARDRVAAARRAVRGSEPDHEAPDRPATTPRTLPAQVVSFTGRRTELACLDDLCERVGPGAAVVALSGMAGVGKTALAIHWAHRAAASFPDGQLYVNLHGYDRGDPISATQALGILLIALGVPPSATPTDLDDRVALYRRLLYDRRMLVVLDNAGNAEQVRQLVPPRPSVAIVTSRDSLADLVSVDGATRLTLDVLPEDEAVALLRRLIGERADREPVAVGRLAELCGYLPLALRVAAEHAAFRSTLSMADLVAELAEGGSDALDEWHAPNDPRADVRTVFSWSLHRLPDPMLRLFQLLGLAPGADLDLYALAALAGVQPEQAQELADALYRAHLIQVDADGRFSMHDLVRAYATESAEHALSHNDRSAATVRLLDYYLTTATLAVDIQFPYGKPARPRNRPASIWDGPAPHVTTVRTAARWLSAERLNLVRACVHAARHGWPGHAVALATALRPFFNAGQSSDGETVYDETLRAAELMGEECDRFDLGFLWFSLSVTSRLLGRPELAVEQAERALAQMERAVSAEGVNLGLLSLSAALLGQGKISEAIEHQQHGLANARSAGLGIQEASFLNNLGVTYLGLEEYETAAGYFRQAVAVNEEIGQRIGLAEARCGLAYVGLGMGHYDEALALAQDALAVELEHGRALESADLMMIIGSAYRGQGRTDDAVDQLTKALSLARDEGTTSAVATVLNALGKTYLEAGDHLRAARCHEEAYEIAELMGAPIEHAKALTGLGDIRAALGDTEQAHREWRRALDAYPDMARRAAARMKEKLGIDTG